MLAQVTRHVKETIFTWLFHCGSMSSMNITKKT